MNELCHQIKIDVFCAPKNTNISLLLEEGEKIIYSEESIISNLNSSGLGTLDI